MAVEGGGAYCHVTALSHCHPLQIDLGGGHVLEFVMAPNLHWPDTMFTYDHATSTMYTCDAFGMHYCTAVSSGGREAFAVGPWERWHGGDVLLGVSVRLHIYKCLLPLFRWHTGSWRFQLDMPLLAGGCLRSHTSCCRRPTMNCRHHRHPAAHPPACPPAAQDPYDSELSPLEPHYRFYYDCLMRPNAKSVTTALRKIKDMPVQIVANGHGPLLRYNVDEMMGW